MKYALTAVWLLAANTLAGCAATGMVSAPHGTVTVATVAPPAGLYRLVLTGEHTLSFTAIENAPP
jgi:hypothetical protein